MNVQNLLKLADALDSGKYIQTTVSMKSSINGITCHCALGVAVEIFIQENPGVLIELKPWNDSYWTMTDQSDSDIKGVLNDTVKDWYGFRSRTGELNPFMLPISASNDAGVDFPTIAATIREYVESLDRKVA